jgi:hypothetical protein
LTDIVSELNEIKTTKDKMFMIHFKFKTQRKGISYAWTKTD